MFLQNISLVTGAAFAPMAGISDQTMREICARYGALFTISEMVSAKAITMGDNKSRLLYLGGGGSAPYGVQLFGQEPDVMAQAVRAIEADSFDFIDINMGCPAPKIVGNGAGSALLKTPALAGELAKAAVNASTRPVTVKMRIGWDKAPLTGVEVAKRCEDAGVALLTVHARTRAQMYKPGVDYAAVAQIKQAVNIPVLYNGDVVDGASALAALQNTGCDGIMIGRGTQGCPWVFEEISAALQGKPLPKPPTLRQRFALLEEQVRAMCLAKGEDIGMRQARGVAIAYLRGLRGAAELRRRAIALAYFTDLEPLIADAYEYNS